MNLIHSVNRPLDPVPALPEMEKSEYERIREANIAEREQEFLRIFGYPLRRKVSKLCTVALNMNLINSVNRQLDPATATTEQPSPKDQ